jgi:hypothetical protein
VPGDPLPPPRHRQCAEDGSGDHVTVNVDESWELASRENKELELESETGDCRQWHSAEVFESWKLNLEFFQVGKFQVGPLLGCVHGLRAEWAHVMLVWPDTPNFI